VASIVFATGAGMGDGKPRPFVRRCLSADPVSGGWFATAVAMLPGCVACGSALLHAERARFLDGALLLATGAAWGLAMVGLCWNVSLRSGNRWLSLAIALAAPLVAITVLLLVGAMMPNGSVFSEVLPVLVREPRLAAGTGACVAAAGLGVLAARRRRSG